MKRAAGHLLDEHLEDISWKVMEQYPQIVRKLIRTKSGVYALYRGNKLYYVGLAKNMMGRINGHLRDRHHGLWDRFSVYLTPNGTHMKELESLLLRIVRPSGNRMSGKFPGSNSLRPDLHSLMKDVDADRRAAILGTRDIERRRRTKITRQQGTKSLAGLSDRAIRLRARYKSTWYRASIRRDGTIRYGDKSFSSPSAAAKAVVQHSCNGWGFWEYRDSSGKWVPLRTLKG